MRMIRPAIRRVFWGLLGLLLLGVGALVAVLAQGDALEKAVLGQISNSLLTRGHITAIDLNVWDEFPLVSLSLEDVWVAGSGTGGPGAGAFSGDTLIRAERIGLTLNALSLLTERPRVEALTLEGATFVLAERADGAWNTAVWRESGDTAAVAFAVDEVRLRDVRLQVGEVPVYIAAAACSGELGAAGLQAGIRAELEVQGVPLEAATQLVQAGEVWRFDGLEVRAWGAEARGVLEVSGEGMQLDLAYESLRIHRLQDAGILPKSTDWASRAPLRGKIEWDGTTWKGHAKCAQAPIALPRGLAPWLDGAPALPIEATCTGTCWFRSDPTGLRLDVPQLQLGGPGFTSEGELTWSGTNLQWEGRLEATPVALLALPPQSDLTWHDGRAEATLTVHFNDRGWGATGIFALDGMRGTVGEAAYQLQAQGTLNSDRLIVASASGAIDAFQFEANGSIDTPFNPLPLSGVWDVHIPHYTVQSDAASAPWWADLDLPPGSDMAVHLAVDTLRWEGNRWTQLVGDARVMPQRLVASGRLAAYRGAVVWDAEATWSPTGARADLAYTATSLDVRQMFSEMADFGQTTLRSEHISGLLDGTGQAEVLWLADGSFDWPALRWRGDQTLREGSLEGVEALEAIPDYLSEHRMIAPLINPSDLREKLRSITLQPISTPAVFVSEMFTLPLSTIQTSDLHVTIEGSQFRTGEMDYSVGIALREFSQMLEDDIGEIMDDGLGNHLFINALGTPDEVEFTWDREAQRNHRRRNLSQEREKLKALWRRDQTYN